MRRTCWHVLIWEMSLFCTVNIHLFLSLISSLLPFHSLSFAFLGQHSLQVLSSPVVILGVLWVLERAGVMIVGELLREGL